MAEVRLRGTQEEIAAVVELLDKAFDVQAGPSKFYPDRDSTTIGRVFLNVVTPTR